MASSLASYLVRADSLPPIAAPIPTRISSPALPPIRSIVMDEGPALLLPTLEPISRPSSTSTTASQAVASLLGISALATGSSVTSSPQLRATNAPLPVQSPGPAPTPTPPNMYTSSPAGAAAALTASGSNLPTCMNCSTSTTPLWRRDEMGSVLCNACGLFLKLHGRPRPISLKTDVIKSRNRVKTMRPDMQMKKKQNLPAAHIDHNGLNMQVHNDATTAAALAAVRRTSQHKTNGHGDDSNSPVSRTETPSMYDGHMPVFQGMDANQFHSPALTQYPMPGGSPGRPASPMNGEHHLEIPQTHEQLLAANSSLKTRVSELEVINELYRGRLTQLEQDQATSDNYRHQAEVATRDQVEAQRKLDETQRQLDDSHHRENMLKRRLDEMQHELEQLKNVSDNIDHKLLSEEVGPPPKKMKLHETVEGTETVESPQSTHE